MIYRKTSPVLLGMAMGLAFDLTWACSRPRPPLPPEPPVVETVAPPKASPAPTSSLPGPVEPPPEVLQVRDDGHG